MKITDKTDSFLNWVDTPPTDGQTPLRWLHKIARILLISLREMNENVLTLRAGYLTYAMLLSMVPILAMSTAVVKGLGGGDQIRELAYSYINTLERTSTDFSISPSNEIASETQGEEGAETQPDLTTQLRAAIDKIFNYVDKTNFATLGTFGMVGIFLSVILVLGQIEKSLNVIWKVKDGRSILRKVADYIALMILFPISINVALASGTMLESQTLSMHLDQFLPMDWLQTLLLKGVPILFLSLTLYVIYIFFPNTKTGGLPTIIGAFVAGFCWFLTQNVYISMQIGVAKYNAIYGSFATIPLFLAWVWVAWLFVLIGAQLAYAIQNEPTYHFTSQTAVPSLRLSAALDVCRTVGERFSAAERTDNEDLINTHRDYSPELVGETVDTLVNAGVLHHSRETGELMLSRPPDQMPGRIIVEAVLGTETPETVGGTQAAKAMVGASVEIVTKEKEGSSERAKDSDNQPPAAAGQEAKSHQN
ncbi:MAG: YihY/virulence factor BrkB family protein [Desulfofustis sp.]|nr:YihY/virulence factor BrkB family protein [Desulfofustis sp.]